jgi:predicted RNA-binding Zn ribbon-like protein
MCRAQRCAVSSRLVDGRRIPDAVAGHPALELCNTRAGWGSPNPKEYLVDFTALAIWARETGLLSPAETRTVRHVPSEHPPQAAAMLHRVLELRGALYAALTTRDRDALATVHGFVRQAVSRSQYVARGPVLMLDGGSGATAIVDRCALVAHRLLEEFGPDAVGSCGGDGCGWLFLDPTHRRRWCVMAICGNRAKARRFADRHRVPSGGRRTVRA